MNARRRKIGELSEATAAGYAVGRQRRGARPDEIRPFDHSRVLVDAFWRGYRRGVKAEARLEQQRLALEVG